MKKLLLPIIIVSIFFACKPAPEKNSNNDEAETTLNKDNEINKEKEWISLFDGKTFDGWHGYLTEGEMPEQWTIEDGTMFFNPEIGNSKGGKNIVTNTNYTNFKLSIQWKISEGGNSGIFWGVNEDPKFKEAYQTGPEIQVLDNSKHPDAKVGGKTHQAGALYDMIAPSQDVVKAVGQWNTCVLLVNHDTNEGKVWLNKVLIVEFPVNGEAWDNMVSKSKFKDWEGFGLFKTGKIGLQDHGDKVWYKEIKIKEL